LLPVWIWVKKNPWRVIKDIFNVLSGRKTWIGYSTLKSDVSSSARPGVYSISQAFPESRNDAGIIGKFELAYTQNYRIINDFRIFVRAFFQHSP
jgi:hypothetical protein